MTSIGFFLQNVPTGRDLYGAVDQTSALDAAPAGSDAREKSFESLLSNLAQSTQDTAVASTTTQVVSGAPVVTALAANSARAAGALSPGTEQGVHPVNFVASQATAAALPSKSDFRAADGSPQSMNAAEESAASPPTSDAKTRASPVTSLLGNLSQRSNAAPPSVSRSTSALGSFALSADARSKFRASAVQVADPAKAALVPQGTTAAKDTPVPQGTAAPPRAAPAEQGTATPSEAALVEQGTTAAKDTPVPQGTAAPPRAAPVEQGTATSSEASLVEQGTAAAKDTPVQQGIIAPAKAALVEQGTTPAKAALVRQGIAAPSEAALVEQGTAAPAETAVVDQPAAATAPPQTLFDRTAANCAQEAGIATSNGNLRAFARASGPSQTSEVSAAVSSAPSSQPTQDSLAGPASAGNARRARNSTEVGQGEAATTVDASSVVMPVTQSTDLAAPVIVAPSPIDAGQAVSPNSAASSTVSSNRTRQAGTIPAPSVSAVTLTSNAGDAATTADSLESASPNSFEMNITALSTATHFAPVTRLSPVQQVSDALAATLPSLFGPKNSSAVASAADLSNEAGITGSVTADALAQAAQPSATSVKTLNLQLQPDTLGQVTIKLNLSDSGLAVQLEAANRQTADLIDKDKQALAQGLNNSGYSVASLEVTVVPQHASHFSSDASSQQGQADPNAGQFGGQPSGHDGSPNGDRNRHAPSALTEAPLGSQNLFSNDAAAHVVGNTGRRDLFV
ncbi:MAG: flagellar hook-length control protein FliK [Beijerinckiaceae bacterium]